MYDKIFYFHKYYKPVFTFDEKKDHSSRILGDSSNKECRFCGKKEPDVSFGHEAHAISELLNNKLLLTNYECDLCNDMFGRGIENQLGIWLKSYRAITQQKTKKNKFVQLSRFIKFKKEDNDFAFTIIDPAKNNVQVDFGIDSMGKKTVKFTVPTDKYVPLQCYLAFVKFAVSIAREEDIQNLSWAINCLSNEAKMKEYGKLQVLVQHSDKSLQSFVTKLYKLDNDCPYNLPMYAFMIAFQDLFFTIYLPKNGEGYDLELVNSLNWIPNIDILGYKNLLWELIDMSSDIEQKVFQIFGYTGNQVSITTH